MTRTQIRRLLGCDAETVLDVLTRRQHLNPHATLRGALLQTIDELRCCPAAVNAAVEWLQLDWQLRIGRLRRTELMQLSRSIYRIWRQSVSRAEAQESAPAVPSET